MLSDGEATDEAWQKAVPALKAHGIRVIGLGVGTPQGGLVPDPAGGVLKDASGNAVLSKLEPATLQQLAAQTDGTYRDAATWVDIADLVGATVAKGHAGNYVEERRVRLEDRFQWFLAPALLLFLLSYWLELPLSPLARAFSTRGRRPLRASAPVIAAALVGLAAWLPPRQALAVATDAPPPQSVATVSQPPDLSATIAELSAKPSLDVPDYERLANDTIGFAAQPASPRGGQRDGIIDDALAAVDRGERSDAHAADWPTLRQKLEALRKPPEPPQSKQDQQQQKQDEKNQQGQGQDQKDQQQQSGGGQSQQSSSSNRPAAASSSRTPRISRRRAATSRRTSRIISRRRRVAATSRSRPATTRVTSRRRSTNRRTTATSRSLRKTQRTTLVPTARIRSRPGANRNESRTRSRSTPPGSATTSRSRMKSRRHRSRPKPRRTTPRHRRRVRAWSAVAR